MCRASSRKQGSVVNKRCSLSFASQRKSEAAEGAVSNPPEGGLGLWRGCGRSAALSRRKDSGVGRGGCERARGAEAGCVGDLRAGASGSPLVVLVS